VIVRLEIRRQDLSQMKNFSVSALSLAAASFAAAASAQSLKFSNDTGGSADFYGQLSPTYQSFDDGTETYSKLQDNAHSNSRIGFNIRQKIGENTLRFNFETSLALPSTDGWSQSAEEQNWAWEKGDLRKLELIYSTDFGTFYAGQGSMATDGTAEKDFSRTTLTSGSNSASDSAAGFFFRNDDTGALTSTTIGRAYGNFDGSRRFRLRYDTPDYNGFKVAAAYGINWLSDTDEDTYYDVALNYGNEFGDFEVEGGIGYAVRDRESGDDTTQWMGSFAGIHTPTGLNFMLAGGAQDDGGSYYYVKGGITREFFSYGASSFALDYYSGNDFARDGSESQHWGVHFAQRIDGQNLDVYAGYRVYSFDDESATDFADASSLLAGLRWRF
jgi:hypothetical protein